MSRERSSSISLKHPSRLRPALCLFFMLVAGVSTSGCDNKEKKIGQSLVQVNGEEITVHQLNGELTDLGANAGINKKQVLEALIDRELLKAEAINSRLDREPNVVHALEKAKAQILAQAYLQRKTTGVKPSKAEINEYIQKHPEFFEQRKQFETNELVIHTKDLDETLKTALHTQSFEETIAWLDAHHIAYQQRQLTHYTTDIPMEMVSKWQALKQGENITVDQGEFTILVFVKDIKGAPETGKVAAEKAEQFLANKKKQEAVSAEISRLRTSANIKYLNESFLSSPKQDKGPVSEAQPKAPSTDGPSSLERGAAGLK